MFFSKTPSLSRLKHILQDQYDIYLKRAKKTDPKLKADLVQLEELIKEEKRPEAADLAQKIEIYTGKKYKKPLFRVYFDIFLALGVALMAATVIRQMWFELYEIPTGSMRPTFLETDHVSVSKTAYGINVPLQTEHFMFEPNQINRGGIVIFSADGLPFTDADSTFLYIFPYKKRYVKRLIGKPGDTLYFYGGNLYGLDASGKPITDFENQAWNKKLEYVPFLNFEGNSRKGLSGRITLKQINQEIGRFTPSPTGGMEEEIRTNDGWVKNRPALTKTAHSTPVALSELWGAG